MGHGPQVADGHEIAAGEGFRLFKNAGTSRSGRPSNAKRQLVLELTGPPGDYALVLHARVVKNGRFDATLGPNPPSPTWPPFDRFTSHVAPGAIWDAATARNVICPGDYVVRTQWKDVDGRPQSHDGEGRVGEIWAGSGTGPTFDGRLGVDFCVPPNATWGHGKLDALAALGATKANAQRRNR